MSSKVPTAFLTATRRLTAEKSPAQTSFVRRVWADPQSRRVAIGVFAALTCVEGWAYVEYGPKIWGEKE